MNGINHVIVRCHCTRTTLDEIGSAGFVVSQLERAELKKAPPFVRPLVIGTAQPSTVRPIGVDIPADTEQTA